MYCLLIAARCLGLSWWIGCPRNSYSPLQAASSMPRIDSRVVLPAPEGPMMVTNSPSAMWSLIWRSTKVCTGPVWYAFSRFVSRIIGSLPCYSTSKSDLQKRTPRPVWRRGVAWLPARADPLGDLEAPLLQLLLLHLALDDLLLLDHPAVEEVEAAAGVA